MNEKNRLSVDLGRELIEAIDARLFGAPVVAILPVACERADFADVGAILPPRAWKLVGPSGLGQAVPQIVEHALGNMNLEGLDCGGLRHRILAMADLHRRQESQHRGQGADHPKGGATTRLRFNIHLGNPPTTLPNVPAARRNYYDCDLFTLIVHRMVMYSAFRSKAHASSLLGGTW